MTKRPENKAGIKMGVTGCGSFACFALDHFLAVPEVALAGVTDIDAAAAKTAADHYQTRIYSDYEALLADEGIDLIYIATPPFLHYRQSMMALDAGKHVICEKPLALTAAEADDIDASAGKKGRLAIANLMQRYNPAFEKAAAIINERLLGAPLYGHFVNCARDSGLGPGHWFWDRKKSGGIFIEHGVHFFDLFAGWFGKGRILAAQCVERPHAPAASAEIVETVHCTVAYGDSMLVNFYHGFHQADCMDRQELRLTFERGDIIMEEWVPTRLRLHGLTSEDTRKRLAAIFPHALIQSRHEIPLSAQPLHGRHRRFEADQHTQLREKEAPDKQALYGNMLTAMLADQTAWIHDPGHIRVISGENGRESVRMAEEATALAEKSSP
jgi:predicted dehydrogenase